MAVDVSQFETVEELDKVYKRRIAQAADDEEAEVKEEYLNAKAAFWQAQAGKAALEAARIKAIEQFPLAKGFEDLVVGDTPEAILNAAKRVHERFEQTKKDEDAARTAAEEAAAAEQAAARAAYGGPAGGGGGATGAAPAATGAEEINKRVMARLERGDGMQDSQSRMDVARWMPGRVAEAVHASINNPSYKSFARNSDEDRRVADARRETRKQR